MSTLVYLGSGVEGMPRPRRLVRVRITVELLTQILTRTGHWSEHLRVQHGLPEGSQLVHAGMDGINNELHLLFEHESFPPTTSPPTLRVEFESFHCGDAKPQDEQA